MKKSYFIVFLMLLCCQVSAQTLEDHVKAAILKAYVGGIHNGGPIEDIEAGFHPSFLMYRFVDNEISTLDIATWIGNIKQSREKNPNPPAIVTECKFLNVLLVGNSANVSLELSRSGKLIFTDHLLLHKFEEGWRIVAKSFYRHQ